jgi:hypothetical protein
MEDGKEKNIIKTLHGVIFWKMKFNYLKCEGIPAVLKRINGIGISSYWNLRLRRSGKRLTVIPVESILR